MLSCSPIRLPSRLLPPFPPFFPPSPRVRQSLCLSQFVPPSLSPLSPSSSHRFHSLHPAPPPLSLARSLALALSPYPYPSLSFPSLPPSLRLSLHSLALARSLALSLARSRSLACDEEARPSVPFPVREGERACEWRELACDEELEGEDGPEQHQRREEGRRHRAVPVDRVVHLRRAPGVGESA